MVEFRYRGDVYRWLEGRPREVAVCLAARAALRVAPALNFLWKSRRIDSPFILVLRVFRATASPWIANKITTNGGEDFRKAARAAADATTHATNAYAAARGTSYVTADAAAAYAAAKTADAAAYAADAAARDNAAAAAAAATAAAAAAAIRIATYAAASADASAIEDDVYTADLADWPLWRDGAPRWTIKRWRSLRRRLLKVDPNWRAWTDWYEDRLVGAEKAARPIIPELERARLLIPEADWEKGPEHTNKLILDLCYEYGWYARDDDEPAPKPGPPPPPPPSPPSPIEADATTSEDDRHEPPPPPPPPSEIRATAVIVDMEGYFATLRRMAGDDDDDHDGALAATKIAKRVDAVIDAGLAAIGAERHEVEKRSISEVSLRRLRDRTLIQGTGDGAILVFETPEAAHRFSIALQRKAEDLNRGALVGAALRKFRIGAASNQMSASPGEAISASNQTIAVAARLEPNSDPGGVLIDQHCWASLPDAAKREYVGEIVPGKTGEPDIAAHRWDYRPDLRFSLSEPSSDGDAVPLSTYDGEKLRARDDRNQDAAIMEAIARLRRECDRLLKTGALHNISSELAEALEDYRAVLGDDANNVDQMALGLEGRMLGAKYEAERDKIRKDHPERAGAIDGILATHDLLASQSPRWRALLLAHAETLLLGGDAARQVIARELSAIIASFETMPDRVEPEIVAALRQAAKRLDRRDGDASLNDYVALRAMEDVIGAVFRWALDEVYLRGAETEKILPRDLVTAMERVLTPDVNKAADALTAQFIELLSGLRNWLRRIDEAKQG